MVRLIISSVNHGVDLFLLFACIFVFFFVFFCFSKKKALDIVRDHCTLLLTDCDLTSFYLFLLSCLILVRVPTLILGCFHSVYTINCWSSGLATSTWTYWAARSLVGLIAKLLLLPRPVLLLPLLKIN